MTTDREEHYIMIKGLLKQEDIAIPDAYAAIQWRKDNLFKIQSWSNWLPIGKNEV